MSSRSHDSMGHPLVALRVEDRGAAGRIAWITFDSPAKRNALGLAGKDLTNLDQIGAPRCRFIALPLKLDGADGSPVRAIAILD